MKEVFEIGRDIFIAVFSASLAVCTLAFSIAMILMSFGFDSSPDGPYYKAQVDRCRERGDVILDASGYLKECRLKSFD